MVPKRALPAMLLLAAPLLTAQSGVPLTAADGNFDLRATLPAASRAPLSLRFRVNSGAGYRIQLSGPARGSLDDPGRRPGLLASPMPAQPVSGPPATIRLVANGPRIQLEWNGTPLWEYTEKESGIPSAGATAWEGAAAKSVKDVQFSPLPPTPQSFAERYGPAVGQPAPPLVALDQSGKRRDFASLRGPKGLWILFIRSADW
jgi:hypothetical protein